MLAHSSQCPQLTRYFGSYVVGRTLWIVMEYLEVRFFFSDGFVASWFLVRSHAPAVVGWLIDWSICSSLSSHTPPANQPIT